MPQEEERQPILPDTYLGKKIIIHQGGVRSFRDALRHHGDTSDPSLDNFHKKLRRYTPEQLRLWIDDAKDELDIAEGLNNSQSLDHVRQTLGSLTPEEEETLVAHGLGSRPTDQVLDDAFTPQEIDQLIDRGIEHKNNPNT